MKRSTTFFAITLSLCALGHMAPVEAGSCSKNSYQTSAKRTRLSKEETKNQLNSFKANVRAWRATPSSTQYKIKRGQTLNQYDLYKLTNAGHNKGTIITYVETTKSVCLISPNYEKKLKSKGWKDGDFRRVQRGCPTKPSPAKQGQNRYPQYKQQQ